MVTNTNSSSNEMIKLPSELINIVWGNEIEMSIFERWSQSFEFSSDEGSALIQHEGGPCSVLTTVEAHLLNELIFCTRCQSNWRILIVNNIESLSLNQENITQQLERRLTATSIELLDRYLDGKNLFLMVTTNRPDSVDTDLRRPGRIDEKIEIVIPNQQD
jgi:hypothetical protein